MLGSLFFLLGALAEKLSLRFPWMLSQMPGRGGTGWEARRVHTDEAAEQSTSGFRWCEGWARSGCRSSQTWIVLGWSCLNFMSVSSSCLSPCAAGILKPKVCTVLNPFADPTSALCETFMWQAGGSKCKVSVRSQGPEPCQQEKKRNQLE